MKEKDKTRDVAEWVGCLPRAQNPRFNRSLVETRRDGTVVTASSVWSKQENQDHSNRLHSEFKLELSEKLPQKT